MNSTNKQFQRFQSDYKLILQAFKNIILGENLNSIPDMSAHYESFKKQVKWWDKNKLREADMTTEQLQQWDDFLRTLNIQPNMLQRSKYLLRQPIQKRKDKTPRQYKDK